MARFNSYSKKEKPDDTDTLLIYDNEAAPDVLKQIEVKGLFEEYEAVDGKTIKEHILELLSGAGVARFS